MKSHDIGRVFIIGAGTMGREIAAQCARRGVRADLFDTSPGALEQARAQLAKLEDGESVLRGIEFHADLAAAAQADLVIEAVPENPELKRRVFAEVSAVMRPEAILATNTSSLIPSQLADAARYPGRVAALHFHLPVAICTIVDVMPHPGTDPGVVESLEVFARKIGQRPIRYEREHHAYIFNSIFGAMQRQALDLVLQKVATVEDVDRAWMGIFRMPLGPFGMFDNIGLDTIAEITTYWAETLNDDKGRARAAFLKSFTSQGNLGTKSGRGFYTYPNPAYAHPDFLK